MVRVELLIQSNQSALPPAGAGEDHLHAWAYYGANVLAGDGSAPFLGIRRSREAHQHVHQQVHVVN